MPTSSDLLNRRFEKSGFGGYKVSDVDSFMTELAAALSQNSREVAELKRKLEADDKKLENLQNEEESLKTTLLNAQRLADQIVREANEKAELTISNAKIKAVNIINCAKSEIEMRKGEADRIKQEVSDFKISVMRLYKTQLELINNIPSVEPPVEAGQQTVQSEPETKENEQVSDATVCEPAETPKKPLETIECASKTADECSIKREEPMVSKLPENAAQPSDFQTEQLPEVSRAESEVAATMQTLKLNLKYNEKTGEYEPIDVKPQGDKKATGFFAKKGNKDSDGLKFGADYNIRTDSFNDESLHHGPRHK